MTYIHEKMRAPLTRKQMYQYNYHHPYHHHYRRRRRHLHHYRYSCCVVVFIGIAYLKSVFVPSVVLTFE